MHFKTLFGIEQSDVQPTCILAPFLHRGMIEAFGVTEMAKGRRFSCGQGKGFTFIFTQIGAMNVGDCTLYLQETNCKSIILIGACGLVEKNNELDIGSIVSIQKAFNYESFAQLLNNSSTAEEYASSLSIPQDIPEVNCASFGSMKLEENYIDELKNKNIDVIEMECAALFTAAGKSIKTAALLYITDIIVDSPIFTNTSPEYNAKIQTAQTQVIQLVKELV